MKEPIITPDQIEEAVEKMVAAREEWAVAIGTLAVTQYQREIAEKLGKMKFNIRCKNIDGSCHLEIVEGEPIVLRNYKELSFFGRIEPRHQSFYEITEALSGFLVASAKTKAGAVSKLSRAMKSYGLEHFLEKRDKLVQKEGVANLLEEIKSDD